MTAPIERTSRFSATPSTPPGNDSSSLDIADGRPSTVAMPSPALRDDADLFAGHVGRVVGDVVLDRGADLVGGDRQLGHRVPVLCPEAQGCCCISHSVVQGAARSCRADLARQPAPQRFQPPRHAAVDDLVADLHPHAADDPTARPRRARRPRGHRCGPATRSTGRSARRSAGRRTSRWRRACRWRSRGLIDQFAHAVGERSATGVPGERVDQVDDQRVGPAAQQPSTKPAASPDRRSGRPGSPRDPARRRRSGRSGTAGPRRRRVRRCARPAGTSTVRLTRRSASCRSRADDQG